MISLKKMQNRFEYISIDNDSASAKIALQGAHIFEFMPHNKRAILWMSQASDYENGKAIRGGIPICWPWFGQHATDESFPQHGFARTSMFSHVESKEVDTHTTQVTLKLQHYPQSLAMFPYRFELLVKITVSTILSIELTTTNLCDKSFEITQALHSYFNISHISNVAVHGLDKKRYYDALTGEHQEQVGDITFSEELDRVYQEVDSVISLVDKAKVINIENEGSASVVVWNPWCEKCSKMSAMENDSYETFVCIESANALDDFILLKPNESHTLKATIA